MPDTRLHIEPERIDELPLALGLLHRMGVPQIVDAHLGSGHGNRQGLSYGQLTHGFSARIITAQDHRLVAVEAWSQEHQRVLSHLLGAPVGDKDFIDDRLADLLYTLGSAGPEMLDQLAAAYRTLTDRTQSAENDSDRLQSIGDDLRWYADRLGSERWSRLPQLNKWSFDQHVWHLTKEAKHAAAPDSPRSIDYYINHGKEHVGMVAEIFALFEYGAAEMNTLT